MKTIQLLALFLIPVFSAFSQEEATDPKKTETIQIQTSAICGMCKQKIEIALYQLKGVKHASVDIKNKIATVKYKPSEVTPDQLRTAISLTGYDADNVPADP